MGIVLAGFVQVLIPKEVIALWLGPASGMTGIIIGSFSGMILTGGAYVVIPIIGSIYDAGAGAGPIIALLTAANLTRIQGLVATEIPIFGVRLSVIRYLLSLLAPPLVGIAGSILFNCFDLKFLCNVRVYSRPNLDFLPILVLRPLEACAVGTELLFGILI
jgi:uncharacterized membrane protein YraQ (UPF0718 family)